MTVDDSKVENELTANIRELRRMATSAEEQLAVGRAAADNLRAGEEVLGGQGSGDSATPAGAVGNPVLGG